MITILASLSDLAQLATAQKRGRQKTLGHRQTCELNPVHASIIYHIHKRCLSIARWNTHIESTDIRGAAVSRSGRSLKGTFLVVTPGNCDGVGNSRHVQKELTSNVEKVWGGASVFAGMQSGGLVVPWGRKFREAELLPQM